jgi:molybdopterin/thiamine biosynthesis adenylyltransferase
MIDLVLAEGDYDAIRADLCSGEAERCAILFANQTLRNDGRVRLLVREIEWPEASDYSRKGRLEAQLTQDLVARITKRARREKESIIFVHSHPGSAAPHFSVVDDEGEQHLRAFLAHRHPDLIHAALVVSAGGVRARRLGTSEEIRVVSIGSRREVLFDPFATTDTEVSEKFDRQVRAFSVQGQHKLEGLRVAIVGLGGTGSLVAQELVHLGVRDFILVDPDVVESSNLNRISHAFPEDVSKPKTEIASRYVRQIAKMAQVKRIDEDVMEAKTARQLADADILFGCTDSHGSRAVMQQVAYQYLIPYIDMGVTLIAREGSITHAYGRAQLLAPGHACFTCSSLLDSNEVRRDMMTSFERQADPYIQGHREPAPAVMSLNGTVSSLAVTMFLAVVVGVPIEARQVLYNALTSSMRAVHATPQPDCYVCSRRGAFARGDSWPIFARET